MIFIVIFSFAVAAYTLTAAITDAWKRKIPNWLTFPTAAAGILFHLTLFVWNWARPFSLPHDEAGKFTLTAEVMEFILSIGPWAFLGFLVGFFLLFLPALFGGSGMGDVKLLAALGAWLGVYGILLAFSFGVLIAAVCVIFIFLAQGPARGMRRMRKVMQDTKDATDTTKKKKSVSKKPGSVPKPRARMLPFGVPMALGTWCFLYLLLSGQIISVLMG
ncbi:MAG: A24 family peptidase [Planctomycetia bacterium]|nr:A24 family peptidase [Planctomycetia bacterium]